MAKLLALLLLANSIAAASPRSGDRRQPPLLSPAQLEQPAAVARWLSQYGPAADRRRAAIARAEGLKDASRGNASASVKGFGESAMWFPSPDALIAYAEAMQRSLAPVRAYRKDQAERLEEDLLRFEQLYRSALASDSVLHSLSRDEQREVQSSAECIAEYRKHRTAIDSCAPLQRYGLSSGR